MGDVHAEIEVQQSAGQMRARSDAGGRILHLVLVGLHVSNQLLQVVHRQAFAGDQDARGFGHQGDRLEVGD
jgi:hypothetical protein